MNKTINIVLPIVQLLSTGLVEFDVAAVLRRRKGSTPAGEHLYQVIWNVRVAGDDKEHPEQKYRYRNAAHNSTNWTTSTDSGKRGFNDGVHAHK